MLDYPAVPLILLLQQHPMKVSRTQRLTETLALSSRASSLPSPSSPRSLSRQREQARRNYEALTGLSKE
jgi:hypothetical protein